MKKKQKDSYKWEFCSLGGSVRVKISKGEDIAHLGELDQKLWTVLSCPTKGLEFNQKTLDILDSDNDGKIRVHEVVSAAEWLTSVIKDKDLILKGESVLPLAQINTENENGQKLYSSAKQILANLGIEKEEIALADTSDSVAIFAKTQFNGDGIITPASADDEALKALITTCVEKIGSEADRSGELGVTSDIIEKFYAECADYAAWQQASVDGAEAIFPYGDNTAAAFAACEAIKDKVADYFMRCKLISFNEDAAKAVDVSVEKIGAISGQNLATQGEEIATYPLARPCACQKLPFEGINPAWQAAFANLKALVLDVDFAGKDAITEAEWNATLAKFAPYTAWVADKKGAAVEALGLDAVKAVIAEDKKAALLELVDKDKALADEAAGIDQVDKLMHLYCYFYKFLRNYVLFLDFYSGNEDEKAVFEVGKLYVDQRCCKLCVKVEDMGAHADMAAQSGMFLLYCTCTSKVKNETMNVVAVMTDGKIKDLKPGKNAIFYDRDGQDWDAVITKVVDNPLSVKQAFFRPYRRFVETITERINKSAEEKDNKVAGDITAKANAVTVPTTAEGAAAAQPKAPFDIAKFAGIFAAIGMAFGLLLDALAGITKFLFSKWYYVFILIAAIILCISGPSCFIAWNKLRKRNLGPVLNANGWAINAAVLVNILFGSTLTSVAKYPKMHLDDPYAPKKTPWWCRLLIALVIIAVVAFAVLYFTHKLSLIGINL